MMSAFTYRDKMRAAQREAGFRRSVYPRRVAAGKMTQAKADEQIALMDEIAADYGRAALRQERAEQLPLSAGEGLTAEVTPSAGASSTLARPLQPLWPAT